MRTLFAALLAAALSGLLASPLRAETLEEIHAKAKGEGALSIYGGGPARLYEGWVKEYEARFPVIKTLEQFRWDWPTRINRLQVQHHFRLAFIKAKANLILLGGVGLQLRRHVQPLAHENRQVLEHRDHIRARLALQNQAGDEEFQVYERDPLA